MIKANINICMGNEVAPRELENKFEKATAIRFAFPGPGQIKQITGLDRILQEPSCQYAQVFVKAGDVIPPITNHPSRPAVVVAEGSCTKEAVSNAERLIDMFRWEFEGV